MNGYTQILGELLAEGVRFVVIGVGGANYYGSRGQTLFATQDRDLFLPQDPLNLLNCWQVFLAAGWHLSRDRQPLEEPVDLWLAERVAARQAAVKATTSKGLEIDLTLEMTGFSFDQVWAARRLFSSGKVQIPVARLTHIIESKRAVGRAKDALFFATHEEMLKGLLERERARRRRSD